LPVFSGQFGIGRQILIQIKLSAIPAGEIYPDDREKMRVNSK